MGVILLCIVFEMFVMGTIAGHTPDGLHQDRVRTGIDQTRLQVYGYGHEFPG